MCKACAKEYHARHYRTNRSAYTGGVKEYQKGIQQAIKDFKIGKPCIDCGDEFHFAAMQFDHRPGEKKEFNLSRGGRTGSLDRVFKEIAKCDLVCANCHAVRTFNRTADIA